MQRTRKVIYSVYAIRVDNTTNDTTVHRTSDYHQLLCYNDSRTSIPTDQFGRRQQRGSTTSTVHCTTLTTISTELQLATTYKVEAACETRCASTDNFALRCYLAQ
eukprot:2599786-Amphidinium_carterae.2